MSGINELSRRVSADDLGHAIRAYRLILRHDEFADTDRVGEYGRLVPAGLRRASSPGATPPDPRLHAFYTFCALEYLLAYEPTESRTEIDRISRFIASKLGPSAGFYTMRFSDGYVAGSHDSLPTQQLNYRHTFALGLSLALENRDSGGLDRLRSLLLSRNLQFDSGGWPIWEREKDSGAADLVCSGYALMLLDYYLRRSQNSDERHLLKDKRDSTLRFFLDKLDRGTNLWPDPNGGYPETFQMSCWYLNVIAPLLERDHSTLLQRVVTALAKGIDQQSLAILRNSVFEADVTLRIALTVLASWRFASDSIRERTLEVLVPFIEEPITTAPVNTYTLTRMLIVLQESRELSASTGSMAIAEHPSSATGTGIARLLGTFTGRLLKELGEL